MTVRKKKKEKRKKIDNGEVSNELETVECGKNAKVVQLPMLEDS